MNYYIADLHLCCKSQTGDGTVNYDNRPFPNLESMHSYILQHWNSKINNGDTVYILGDMAFRYKDDEYISLVAQLKGKKVLVKGNHDDLSDYRYRQLFAEVCDYKEIVDNVDGKAYKLCLMHYPVLMWNGQHNGTILLYGHTHDSVEDTFFQDCIARMNDNAELKSRRRGTKDIQAYNVGCVKSWMNYEPRTLKEILSQSTMINKA